MGPEVQTVLGLSMTSTSVGWMLLDRQGPDALTLDHDAFEVQPTADGTIHDTSQHAAAARGAQAIATASGHTVGSVRVTWSEDVEADATALLKSLADLGFDNVHGIPLSQATQAWGIEVGRANEHNKTALCILEPGTATLMVVATGAGSVRTATRTREHAADLVDWLTTTFSSEGWLPESLYLIGADDDLDAVSGPIGDALPIPVFDSADNQLALAIGAALTTVSPVAVRPSRAAQTPGTGPPPRRDRPWLVSDAKRVTMSAAAVAIVGAGLLLAVGSALNVENVFAQEANPSAAGASGTSVSIHMVPARISAPPAPPSPPETPLPSAEPVSVVVPEPVSVPVRQQTVSPALPAAPLVVPAAPGVLPPAVPLADPQPLGVPPGPVAPPPAALLGVPPGPGALPPAAPLAASPALFAPPPAPEPADLAPPQEPMGAVSNPLFSALP
jgi:hypothetical protein